MIKRLAIRLVMLAVLLIAVPAFTTSFDVQAGHTTVGGYCTPCGCGACLCDPGEQPGDCNGGQSATIGDSTRDLKPKEPAKGDVDFGSIGILGLVVMFLLRRFSE